ncbi:MAG: DUF2911 domain-containing protein [Cytophagales bacterium]|nr:DUF2911 domain-containing protein [Cytophagales bacterium]
MKKMMIFLPFTLLGCSYLACAQTISLPPVGDNQKCSVVQWIGLVSVSITYNSPDVTGPDGESRKGKIWGGVVPYGMTKNNFGTAGEIPWRAGANENTVISFSHDVRIEGKEIPAGAYGVHMIPSEEKWTIIFSRNSSAWGSYFYDSKDDVLRVDVLPEPCPYTEWLTYDFIEKRPTFTVAALKWEELMIPFKIEANVIEAYLNQIRTELQGPAGFKWQNWIDAIDFCIRNNTNLEEALLWSDYAISAPFVGERNFSTLGTKAKILILLKQDQEAENLIEAALEEPTATLIDIHEFGKDLIKLGETEYALQVFELNRKKFPMDGFTTFIGLALVYSALGKTNRAIKNYRLAAENAPEGQSSYYLSLASELASK